MPKWIIGTDGDGHLVPDRDLLDQRFLTRMRAQEAIMQWAADMGVIDDAYSSEYKDGRVMISIPKGSFMIRQDGLYWRVTFGGYLRKLTDREMWIAGQGRYPIPDGELVGKRFATYDKARKAVLKWAADHAITEDVAISIHDDGSTDISILSGTFMISGDEDKYYTVQFIERALFTPQVDSILQHAD